MTTNKLIRLNDKGERECYLWTIKKWVTDEELAILAKDGIKQLEDYLERCFKNKYNFYHYDEDKKNYEK